MCWSDWSDYDPPASTLGPIRSSLHHATGRGSAPLSGPFAAASDAARRLLTPEVGDISPTDNAAVIERICERLRIGLGRWIGPDGYRALLRRALDEQRATHPDFARLACDGDDGARITEAVNRSGPEPSLAALESLVGILINLLGRIVGETMATRLIEQAVAGGPAGYSSTTKSGEAT